jgi:hypothetical protein
MRPILKCCSQPFAVQKMELSHETWVLGANVDERVRFCPFCGRNLTLRTPDKSGGSPVPEKSTDKVIGEIIVTGLVSTRSCG